MGMSPWLGATDHEPNRRLTVKALSCQFTDKPWFLSQIKYRNDRKQCKRVGDVREIIFLFLNFFFTEENEKRMKEKKRFLFSVS